MKELTEKYRQFSEERDWGQFHTPENLAKSICIEAGELLECFQWSDDYDREHLCEELADVVSYCIMLADSIGADLKGITLAKLEKNKAKYPVDCAKGVSTKYDRLLRREEK